MKTLIRYMLLALSVCLVAPATGLAQENLVDVIPVPHFQIMQNLCPQSGHCFSIWRLSPSGQYLFAYFVANSQLYVVNSSNNITQYDLSGYPAVEHQWFDFVPYSDNSILFYNGWDEKLYKYDFVTQLATEYLPSHRFTTCNSDYTPPIQTFVRPFASHWLVVCGFGSSTGNNRNISVIDLVTDTIYEIGTMNQRGRNGREEPWFRVYVGYDGTVYAILRGRGLSDTSPDYNYVGLEDTVIVSSRGLQDSQWHITEIPNNLDEIGAERSLGQLAGIDGAGNLYFETILGKNLYLGPQIAKVNPAGDIVWYLPREVFGGMSFLIDVDSTGDLIVVNTDNTNSTLGLEIKQYDINRHPIAGAGTDQTLANDDSSGSEQVTLDGSGSSDLDGTIVSYSWSENEVEIATGVNPQVNFNVGIHTVTLTVTDDDGATDTDEVVITVNPGATGATITITVPPTDGTTFVTPTIAVDNSGH